MLAAYAYGTDVVDRCDVAGLRQPEHDVDLGGRPGRHPLLRPATAGGHADSTQCTAAQLIAHQREPACSSTGISATAGRRGSLHTVCHRAATARPDRHQHRWGGECQSADHALPAARSCAQSAAGRRTRDGLSAHRTEPCAYRSAARHTCVAGLHPRHAWHTDSAKRADQHSCATDFHRTTSCGSCTAAASAKLTLQPAAVRQATPHRIDAHDAAVPVRLPHGCALSRDARSSTAAIQSRTAWDATPW